MRDPNTILVAMTEYPRVAKNLLVQFRNCVVYRDNKLLNEDFWIEDGKIKNPEVVFYTEKRLPDMTIDCGGYIIAPGFIDIQINGGFGVDFSCTKTIDALPEKVQCVAKGILQHGVTTFCPTIISSTPHFYKKALPKIKRRAGDNDGAGVAGIHLEGPFINKAKNGAHPISCIVTPSCAKDVSEMYNNCLDQVAIVTMAPEIPHASEIINFLTSSSIRVSLGHSMSSLADAETAVEAGATGITHLWNAMIPFNHHDPGMIGLLSNASDRRGKNPLFFGIIADGVHTKDSALRIAYRTLPEGLMLITDAMAGLGMGNGRHNLGDQVVDVTGMKAVIADTETLAGSVASLDHCLRYFVKAARCSIMDALECATLHPAQFLGIQSTKGTLNFGTDADFVLIDPDNYTIQSTFINGNLVWSNKTLT